MPCQLVAACEQFFAQLLVSTTVADIPLSACNNLEWTVALFVKLHRVSNCTRLINEFARLAQNFDRQSLCLFHCFSGEPRILLACIGRHYFWSVGNKSTITTNYWASCQFQFTPPNHVGQVTECANHGDARTLVWLGQRVGVHWYRNIENWRVRNFAEQMLVSRIVWVGD